MKINNNNPLAIWFGGSHMDQMHDYPSETSNVRYYHRLKARFIQNFLTKESTSRDKKFLDAGAGRGPYSVFASKLFAEVYCDEYNAEELEYAKAYVKENSLTNVICKQSDLVKTEYPDNYFDLIVCSEVLEHIPKRELAVVELTRILKPGGRILISMPQKNSLFYQRVLFKHKHLRKVKELPLEDPQWETFQHLRFSAQDIRNLVSSAGLQIIKTGGVNVLPLNQKAYDLFYSLPPLFYAYCLVESLLEKIFPFFGSFYFVELTKK